MSPYVFLTSRELEFICYYSRGESEENSINTFIDYFLLLFFEYIKLQQYTLHKQKITEIELFWPKSYYKVIKENLNIDAAPILKKLKELLSEKPINSELKKLLYNPSRIIIKLSLINTLSLTFLLCQITNKELKNKILELKKFIVDTLLPRANIHVEEDVLYFLSKLSYSILYGESKEEIDTIRNQSFVYLLEEPCEDLLRLFKENQFAKGLNKATNKIYDFKIYKINEDLHKIISHKDEHSFIRMEYHLNFLEVINKKFFDSLQKFSISDDIHYLYIKCENKFINQRILSYYEKLSTNPVEEVIPDVNSKPIFSNNTNYYVKNINNIKDNKKQKEFWNSLINKGAINRKVIFFDKNKPRSLFIELEPSLILDYTTGEINNNISQVFHSLLPDEAKKIVDNEVKSAIDQNSFANLIVIKGYEVDYSIMYRAIINIYQKPGLTFNYRSQYDWYEYRENYTNLMQEKIKSSKSSVQSENNNKYTVSIKKKGNYVCFNFNGKDLKLIKYNKGIMYFILIIKYSQENNGRGIHEKQLVDIINWYFPQKRINLKKRIESKDIDTHDKDYFTLNSALKSKGIQKLPPKLKNFIRNQITFENRYVKFNNQLVEQPDKIIEVDIKDDTFGFNSALFENNYFKVLEEFLNNQPN